LLKTTKADNVGIKTKLVEAQVAAATPGSAPADEVVVSQEEAAALQAKLTALEEDKIALQEAKEGLEQEKTVLQEAKEALQQQLHSAPCAESLIALEQDKAALQDQL